jgi:hypothetical protein
VTRARLGALVLLIALPVLPVAQSRAQVRDRAALVLQVPGASFEDLMGVRQVFDLARSGGAAILVPQLDRRELLFDRAAQSPGVTVVDVPLSQVGAVLDRLVGQEDAARMLVVVAGVQPPTIGEDGDTVTGIVLASGDPASLLRARSAPGSLTSDSTRREGVVSDVDVSTSVLGFLDAAGGVEGSPIRVVPEPPPFELHQRYLAHRRMYVPVGAAAAIYLSIVGILGIVGLALGQRMPRGLRRASGWGCLSVAALATGLLAAGHLPELTYASVIPFVALVTVFGTLAFAPLERREVLLVPAGIGAAVLGYLLLEAILRWSAALTPFVGGSELDGGRFFGLPNVFIGLVIGASLWLAQRLRTRWGFALLITVALLAGLPQAGANLGGAVSLFAAAGLWLAVRERARLGAWRGTLVAAAVIALGTAAILLAHALFPVPTHVSRLETSGLGGRLIDRLRVGFDLIARNPLALIPVLGLPVVIAVVLRPPAPLRPVLERSPAWRDAILVTLLAGAVAYVANDSGPAATGFAFGLALGGLLGVSLLDRAGKMLGP